MQTKAYYHICSTKSSCTRPLREKIQTRSVSRKKHVTWRKNIMHTDVTELNFLMHEKCLKKKFVPVPNYKLEPPSNFHGPPLNKKTLEDLLDTRLLDGLLKRFSFNCRKVISFTLTTPHDWLKNSLLFVIQCKVKLIKQSWLVCTHFPHSIYRIETFSWTRCQW